MADKENNFAVDFRSLTAPMLLVSGVDDFLAGQLNRVSFDQGPVPRYRAALAGIGHWPVLRS